MQQIIGITGGTGFVGQHLKTMLIKKGHEVVIFTRNPNKKTNEQGVEYAYWNPSNEEIDIDILPKLNSVIHLAGAGVADKRWTNDRKKVIVSSRVDATNFLVKQLKQYAINCNSFIAASATGYYGPDRTDQPFKETDQYYNDFLGNTCYQWETASKTASDKFRTVIIRIGIVLGKEAGAFKEFEKPTKFGIVPILGSGKQIISWIHVQDLASLFTFAIETDNMSGIYNGVAPNPASNKELMKTIAQIKGGIKIPVPVPSFVLKLMLGEMSIEILKSCTASSEKIEQAGFQFQYPVLANAINDLLH
ncbi:MAG: TIGR01777 family oxidoreductase [Flavipsychrobacter sp.]